jgi:formylmethanofuran--tetrahydromethanopterin N-formyltransferase
VSQCVLTSPTSAVFAGMEQGEPLPLGKYLRFFGDGHQTSKLIGGRRFWRIPVMDGEFLIEDTTDMISGVGGGNFLVLAESREQALAACESAVAAMRQVPNVIMPFPGGVVRSGSKVGSKYTTLRASTNDAFCPTIKGVTATQLTPDIGAVMEIVIDGLTPADIRGHAVGIRRSRRGAQASGSPPGITAGLGNTTSACMRST